MVIGNGLLGKKFVSYIEDNDVLIFASGISHSKLISNADIEREERLLMSSIQSSLATDSKVIYFSTTSIYDNSARNSDYVKHKQNMESIVHRYAKSYLIFRLPNLVGFTGNNNTLFNFLLDNIVKQTTFTLWKGIQRNVLDVDDIKESVDCAIKNSKGNNCINLANPFFYKVEDILWHMENFLNKKAKALIVEYDNSYDIPDNKIFKYINRDLSVFEIKNYLEMVLNKYYSDINGVNR